MNTALLYRVASVLLVLFAAGHTLGFRRTDPRWGAESLVTSMRTTRFDVQGFQRSYWDFYVGFGLFVTAFLFFAAILSWQLGGLSRGTLQAMPAVTWGLAICLLVVTFLSYRYFFAAPVIFSALVTLCLFAAAWLSSRPA